MEIMSLLPKILKPVILAIFIVISNCMFAQTYKTSSKKAIKYFQKAVDAFLVDKFESIQYVDKALKYDGNFTDAILLKAELCLDLKYDSLSIEMYERLFEIDSMAFPKAAISLSKLYAKHLCFNKAISLLDWYLNLDNQKEKVREIAEKQLMLMKYQKILVENPVDYRPKNIGFCVNTSDDEYVNQYYVNENKIIFTKRYKSISKDKSSLEENVFITTMYDSVGSIPQLLFDNLKDIGAANISPDGNEIYFSASSWKDGKGSCDIYCTKFENNKWSTPENINSINTSDWESQPCVSYDGKELFFVRRNKKLGTSDIYVAFRDDNGEWKSPQKLNPNINTEGNEMAPFVHHDGKTLYFSSDGLIGMGGYDLFMSRRDQKGEWMDAVNLGYPLNTSGNEINIVVSNDANKAYISAIRNEGYGAYDIYEFELDEEFRPESVEIETVIDEEYYADVLNKQKSVVLKNIYFEFDSDELNPDSEAGINTLYNFMLSNPEKTIVLEGHTDDSGDENYNLELSKRRAESVKNALINKGINEERIKTKGCGSTQPLFPNNFDDELKFLNRRVSMSFDIKP